jgi:hypothetical protein
MSAKSVDKKDSHAQAKADLSISCSWLFPDKSASSNNEATMNTPGYENLKVHFNTKQFK